MSAMRIVVHGGVHGVLFRDTCTRLARAAGVAGWVRNDPEGTVEAVFEGDQSAVDTMVDWCRSGPPKASVERVEATVVPESGLSGFETRS